VLINFTEVQLHQDSSDNEHVSPIRKVFYTVEFVNKVNGCRLHATPRLPRRVPIDRSDARRRSINQWTIDLYGAVGAGRVDQDQPTDCLQSESRPYPEGAPRDGCLGGPPQPAPLQHTTALPPSIKMPMRHPAISAATEYSPHFPSAILFSA